MSAQKDLDQLMMAATSRALSSPSRSMLLGAVLSVVGAFIGFLPGCVFGFSTGASLGDVWDDIGFAPKATATIDLPDQVKAGEIFDVTINIHDTMGSYRMIEGFELIDPGERFTIIDTTPDFQIDPTLPNRALLIGEAPLPAYASSSITLRLRADAAGESSATLVAWIGYRTLDATFVVDVHDN